MPVYLYFYRAQLSVYDPEIASVGITEEEARRKGFLYAVANIS